MSIRSNLKKVTYTVLGIFGHLTSSFSVIFTRSSWQSSWTTHQKKKNLNWVENYNFFIFRKIKRWHWRRKSTELWIKLTMQPLSISIMWKNYLGNHRNIQIPGILWNQMVTIMCSWKILALLPKIICNSDFTGKIWITDTARYWTVGYQMLYEYIRHSVTGPSVTGNIQLLDF